MKETKGNSLEKNISIFDRCMKEISRADLNGKYQKSFRELRKKILEEVNETVLMWLADPVVLSRELTPEEQQTMQSIVDGYRKQLQQEIYEKRDTNGFYEVLGNAQSALFDYIKEHGGIIDTDKIPERKKEDESENG